MSFRTAFFRKLCLFLYFCYSLPWFTTQENNGVLWLWAAKQSRQSLSTEQSIDFSNKKVDLKIWNVLIDVKAVKFLFIERGLKVYTYISRIPSDCSVWRFILTMHNVPNWPRGMRRFRRSKLTWIHGGMPCNDVFSTCTLHRLDNAVLCWIGTHGLSLSRQKFCAEKSKNDSL